MNQLNGFFGPLQQYLGKSRQLYEQFSYGKGDDFRTLIALLEGWEFEGNDAELLREIIDVTKQIDTLILEHGGLVDSTELRHLLSQATGHFTYMRLAYEKKLRGDLKRFEKLVYPRELNKAVDDKVQELQNRLRQLNQQTDLLPPRHKHGR